MDEKKLQVYFGDDQYRVMQLLSTEIDTSRFDIRDKDRISFAQQSAINWLAARREGGLPEGSKSTVDIQRKMNDS